MTSRHSANARGPATRARDSRNVSGRWTPYLFLSPFLLLFGIFGALAVTVSLVLSFTNWQGVAGGEFVGLDNYAKLVTEPSFRQALAHTVVVWCLTVPVLSFGGLALAWVLQSRLVRMKALLRTLFFLPVLPSLVVTGLVFLLLLDPRYGLPNVALRSLGLDPINLRVDPAVSVPLVAVIVIWRWLGYNMIIHLAGLQAISTDVLQAARVDGAGGWRLFWHVVVPMSKPVLVFTAVLSTIGVFNLFDEPYILFGTQGGPEQAGLMLGPLMFREAFENFDLGYASAIAYALTVMVVVASLVQARMGRDG